MAGRRQRRGRPREAARAHFPPSERHERTFVQCQARVRDLPEPLFGTTDSRNECARSPGPPAVLNGRPYREPSEVASGPPRAAPRPRVTPIRNRWPPPPRALVSTGDGGLPSALTHIPIRVFNTTSSALLPAVLTPASFSSLSTMASLDNTIGACLVGAMLVRSSSIIPVALSYAGVSAGHLHQSVYADLELVRCIASTSSPSVPRSRRPATVVAPGPNSSRAQ